jgi:hypothetical protein
MAHQVNDLLESNFALESQVQGLQNDIAHERARSKYLEGKLHALRRLLNRMVGQIDLALERRTVDSGTQTERMEGADDLGDESQDLLALCNRI